MPPSVVESPSPSDQQSAPPSASPSPQTFSVVVTDEHGIDHPVEVIDESGRLVAVDPGPAYTGPVIGEAAASLDPESDTRLFVTWAFTGCDDPTSITIDETALVVLVERPECQGDAIGGNPHQVTLTFDGPVDAAALDVQLVETPGRAPRSPVCSVRCTRRGQSGQTRTRDPLDGPAFRCGGTKELTKRHPGYRARPGGTPRCRRRGSAHRR